MVKRTTCVSGLSPLFSRVINTQFSRHDFVLIDWLRIDLCHLTHHTYRLPTCEYYGRQWGTFLWNISICGISMKNIWWLIAFIVIQISVLSKNFKLLYLTILFVITSTAVVLHFLLLFVYYCPPPQLASIVLLVIVVVCGHYLSSSVTLLAGGPAAGHVVVGQSTLEQCQRVCLQRPFISAMMSEE